jgi:predicted enzyme related to lactoylglutathione lyase
LKLDHIYLNVESMDRAIKFWEEVLDQKISSRNGERWANFSDNGFYLGLYSPTYDGEKNEVGNNINLVLSSENIKDDHDKLKTFSSSVTNIHTAGDNYKYFHFTDSEGNSIEVAQY